MLKHIDDSTLKAFIDGRLSPNEEIKIRRHISSCQDCYDKYEFLCIGKLFYEELKEESVSAHLDNETIMRFSGSEITDEKEKLSIIDHLIVCKQCREKWIDFEEFSARMVHSYIIKDRKSCSRLEKYFKNSQSVRNYTHTYT